VSAPILVVGEVENGRLSGSTLEAISVGGRLAGGSNSVVGFVTGPRAREAANDFGRFGVARVSVVSDAALDGAPVAVAALAVAAAADRAGADTILVGGSPFGRDLAGRLAIRWKAAVATGVTDARRDGAALHVRRPIFGGRATETRRLDGGRFVLALRPHAFAAPAESSVPAVVE
jgi:electron transfer flavoprotein alpha subunit